MKKTIFFIMATIISSIAYCSNNGDTQPTQVETYSTISNNTNSQTTTSSIHRTKTEIADYNKTNKNTQYPITGRTHAIRPNIPAQQNASNH